MVVTVRHSLETSGQGDAHDLTSVLTAALADSSLANGIATVSVVGSTAGITTLEFESGVVRDLNETCERLAPRMANT